MRKGPTTTTPPLPPRPDLPRAPGSARKRRRWLAAVALIVALTLVGGALFTATGARVAGTYVFLETESDGAPYRWNPCEPIHYEVNILAAPDNAMADVREAVGRVSEATGIAFVFDGTTTRTVDRQISTAFQNTAPGADRWWPLLIAWVPHEHFDFLADTRRAAAFGVPHRGDGELAHTYVSGVVAIDAGDDLPPGFEERFGLGVVLMHELGHVMGLGHVASGRELMWSPDVDGASGLPDPFQTDWGPGDREGLRRLGRDAGCRS